MNFDNLTGGISNGDWVSEDEINDPTPLPELTLWHVLVRPLAVKLMSKGGVIIPPSVRDDMKYLNTCGRVLRVGPLAYKHKDFEGMARLPKVGEFVLYDKFAGKKQTYKGVKLLLLQDRDIMQIVEDPEWLI